MTVAGRQRYNGLRDHIGRLTPQITDPVHAHGDPLGADEDAVVKDLLGLRHDDFWSPDDVIAYYRSAGARLRTEREAWERRRAVLRTRDASLADEHDACLAQRGLPGWEAKLPTFAAGESIATRVASHDVLNAIIDVVPGLVTGGADLTGNTGTKLDHAEVVDTHRFGGRQVHFGVREFGMAAVLNGMAVSGTLPAGGTFFVFSDYMRPAVRLAALSGYKTAFVWTHDSVGLGEDGPTHQPVEHLASLRAMSGLRLIRPADANEVAQAWRVHVDGQGPTGIVLSRQKIPVLEGTAERAADGVPLGAYVLVDEDGPLDLVLVGTGSEVGVCVDALGLLAAEGTSARVVSMPSWDLFDAQPAEYRDAILPPRVPTLAVEAGASLGWERYADAVVAIDRFGASAPGPVVLAELGFTPENVAACARALLEAPREIRRR